VGRGSDDDDMFFVAQATLMEGRIESRICYMKLLEGQGEVRFHRSVIIGLPATKLDFVHL